MLALLSDVHANLEALDAVLRDVDARAPGARLVCSGDVVGYGADPEACLQRLVERDAIIVRGNHEEMVLGVRDTRQCVAAGIRAVSWTQRTLSRPLLALLRGLPNVARAGEHGEVVVCHGTVDDAGIYVSNAARAAAAIARARAMFRGGDREVRFVVCGHTHTPMSFQSDGVLLVNPGAVGQARDGVVRARYALLDPSDTRAASAAVKFCDVDYDASRTVEKMRAAGLVPAVTLTPPRGVVRRHVERAKAIAERMSMSVIGAVRDGQDARPTFSSLRRSA